MEKSLHRNILLILLLTVSVVSMGQYTGSFPNVATFKTASASGTVLGLGPELAVDSSLTTFCSVTGAAPAWIMVDLGSLHNINGFGMMLPIADELPRELTIQASEDGITWEDISNITVDIEGTYSYDVSSVTPVQYYRYSITSKDSRASFADIMLYGYEWIPPFSPIATEASDIDTNLFTANWRIRDRTEGYILVVATDSAFNDRVDGYEYKDVGDETEYSVTGLTPGTTYYYVVKAYNLAGSSVYSNRIETVTLKVAQTITFEDLPEKIYGDAEFELVATATSALPVSFTSSADSIASISGTTVSIRGAGTVSITAIQNGDAMYDTAAPVIQELLVSVKELTVTGALAVSKEYDGTSDAEINGAVLDGVIGTDDVSLSDADMGQFAQADVGLAIEVTSSMTLSGADSANYTLVQPSTLSADINEKELVITAGEYSREECEENPELDVFDISGFVNGEDETIMTESPLASCTADQSSPPGVYEVVPSGGIAPNYMLTYINGNLTVTLDITSPSLTVQAIVVDLDEDGNATISPADLVVSAEDNCAVSDTTLSQNTFTTDDIGNVDVEVIATDAAGNSTSEMATVTVNGPSGFDKWLKIEANVYPNPTDGKLELEFNSPVDVLKVIDITGKTLIRKNHLNSQETLDLSEFRNGIYVLQFQSGQLMKHVKIMKK